MRTFHLRTPVVCAATAVLLTGLSATTFVSAQSGRPNDRPTTVPASAPVVDAATLERGRYIVKTSGCNDCHTPGYSMSAGNIDEKQWLTGDALGWQGPWGTTYPINVRLFMQELNPQQWLQVARSPARPPMPWFALRDMTDQDLLAVYHYVRSLGPAGSAAPAYVPPGVAVRTPAVKFPG